MNIEEIKPGMEVGCAYRLQHCGVVLPPDAPAARAASLAFPDTDAQNPPEAERVRAHVEWCLSQGLLRGRYPVAWSFGKVYWEGVDALFPYWPATCSQCRAKINHDDMRREYDAGTAVCFDCYCKNREARWDELRELVAGEVRAALESGETVVEVWGGEERHWPRCTPFVESASTPERLAVHLAVRYAGFFTTLRFAGGKTYDEPFLLGFLRQPPRQLPADNSSGRQPSPETMRRPSCTMITDFTQRWRDRRATYKLAGIRGETFNPRHYEVAEIEERVARAFVVENHYSGSFPSALVSFGLFRGEKLCGTFVSSVPQGKRVLAKVFPDGEGMPTDCGRFVLTDEVELNGESWFHARCRELLTRMGFTGLLAFADDVRRTNVQGEIVFLGHLGISYRAGNAMFLGRGTARTVQLLPDGRVFGERAISKIRKGEKGRRGAAARLEALGAPPAPEDPRGRLTWLHAALAAHTRPLRHPGPLRYARRLHPRATVLGTPQRYPRLRHDDIQPMLFAA